jgi:hypothetical protein
MFVVSKIDILEKQKKPYTLEPHEKQVFIEFEKTKVPSQEDPSMQVEKVQLYKFHKGADENFVIVATDAEMQYCVDNKALIKNMRQKALKKDIELCRSDISIV